MRAVRPAWRAPSLVAALALVLSLLCVPPASAADDPAPVGAAATPVVHEVTVVRVNSAGTTQVVPTPIEDVVDAINGPVAEYWADQTGGTVQFSATGLPQWVSTTVRCDNYSAFLDQVADAVGFVPGPGKVLLAYTSSTGLPSAWTCFWELGSADGPWVPGVFSVRDGSVEMLAHVLGHSLGLDHSYVSRCGPDRIDGDQTQCFWTDGPVLYDVMSRPWWGTGGALGPLGKLGSLNPARLSALGVLPAAQTATIRYDGRGGRFTLSPISGTSGTRALRLVDEYGDDVWVEYRPAAGRDAWLADPAQNTLGYDAGVLLHRGPTSRGSTALLDGSPTAVHDQEFALRLQEGRSTRYGRFLVRVAQQTAGSALVTVTAARNAPFPRDRTGDGWGDVLAVAPDGTLYLYARDNGSLTRRAVGRGWQSRDLLTTVGDWDSDGRHDVMARDPRTGELWLYSGNDTGGFRSWRVIGRGWNGVDALFSPGDWDGDGAVDLLARSRRDGRLLLYPGDGLGGFLPSRQVGTGWGALTAFGTCPDWDSDGAVDFAARRSSDGALMLYEGDGSGGFGPTRRIGTGWNVFTAIVGTGHLSFSGSECNLMARRSDGKLWTYEADGEGGWQAPGWLTTGWNGFRLFN